MVSSPHAARDRIWVAVALSLLVHALLFSLPARKRALETLGGAPSAFQVTLDAATVPQAESAPQAPAASAPPPSTTTPVPRPRVLSSRERSPKGPPPAPPEEPTPPASVPPAPRPQVDMLAMIEARRAERRAADAASARAPQAPAEPSPAASAIASINRNLQTLGPGEGVGGVFQILRMGPRTGEFAFNGFRSEGQRRWREVIEVKAGPQGDIERAMVGRMIELIRAHYSGDFNWNSHRLGRVVVLSARPENNEALENYLLTEFFGTPLLKRTK